MNNLNKSALTKTASGKNHVVLRVAGKSKIEFSPSGASMVLDKFSDAKHELYDSPKSFFKIMRETFGANWRAKLVS
ncbi:hypothetical protein VpasPP24_35 [Vibrio phage Vpas_PP24]|nr:hypothetical protein VpasPP24_35 [Vibrio phage Vpas_PP24]